MHNGCAPTRYREVVLTVHHGVEYVVIEQAEA